MTPEATEKTSSRKFTESAGKIRTVVKRMYQQAQQAKEEKRKVAYCMVMCNYEEILAAMDIVQVYTENYAGLCAVKRQAESYMDKARAEGYSDLLCGYAQVGIGFDAMRHELGEMPPDAPDGGMPEPDMLLGCSMGCDPRWKWYQALGRYKDTPIYNMDVLMPPSDADMNAIREHSVRYMAEELRGLVRFLEEQTGRRMDYDRLMTIVRQVEETRRWWRDAYELRKAIPAPMTTQDHFVLFVPHHMMLADSFTLEFYKGLYDELKERVDNKIGAIDDERYRLLWGVGLPPWHSMYILDYFLNFGAVFAAETAYMVPEPFEIPADISDPVEIIALRAFERNTALQRRGQEAGDIPPLAQAHLERIKDYNIDGVVMHITRSCRASTMGQILVKNVVRDHYPNMPVMFMESDIIDLGTFSDTETKDRIDSFMEMVDAYKKKAS
ncbi:MAG: 2-hydroxyacyl-CoA dehydratase family protein [Dehalococcoidia bacterium]|nr:2-hydroxyacyl-CoA dehydratase family protein [Dehalococcoidia bacterium]